MRKLLSVFSFILLSLSIISCQENADLDAYDEGEDLYKDSHINYYLFDGSDQGYSDTQFIPTMTTSYEGTNEYLITTTKSKKKIIKNAVPEIYYQDDPKAYGTIYYMINENNVDKFVEEYYEWYPEDEYEELVEKAEARLKDWFGTAGTPPSNAFYERVFWYADSITFNGEPNNGENGYEIITQAEYLPFQDVYGNGKRLIMKKDGIKVYDFNDVVNSPLGSTVNPLSKIDFQNTVNVIHPVPNGK